MQRCPRYQTSGGPRSFFQGGVRGKPKFLGRVKLMGFVFDFFCKKPKNLLPRFARRKKPRIKEKIPNFPGKSLKTQKICRLTR